MPAETYIQEVEKLLSAFYRVQLNRHGRKAAEKAHSEGQTPGQFAMTIARNDSLQSV